MDNERDTFVVTGMHCAACASSVASILQAQAGVDTAVVNYAGETVRVDYDPVEVTPAELQTAVRGIGYDLVLGERHEARQQANELRRKHLAMLKKRLIIGAALTVPVVLLSMVIKGIPYADYIVWGLTTVVVFFYGRDFFFNAWKQLQRRRANMDTLVAMSTGTAYVYSAVNLLFQEKLLAMGASTHLYFEAAAVIVIFIMLGRFLEERAKAGTSESINKLMQLQPTSVTRVQSDGSHETIDLAKVKPGDHLLLRPGEKVPVDGTVLSGDSYVDESTINGESVPAFKTIDSELWAGTVNQAGTLVLVAARVGADTVLSRIIRVVEEAQGSKAPIQRLADKIAGIFVPVVLVIATISLLTWILVGDESAVTHGILAFVTVLIIACPCALGLATPTALMVGIGRGAEMGILIKDAVSLERAEKVDTLIFDKTGTVTRGEPVVADIFWKKPDADRALMLDVLYSLESMSEHPLAAAVMNHLQEDSELVLIKSFENIPGQGIMGTFRGGPVLAGTRAMMQQRGIAMASGASATEHVGASTIFFAADSEIVLEIRLTDEVQPEAERAVADLHKQGLQVILASGDAEGATKLAATAVGADSYHSRMLPEDKLRVCRELQDSGKVVAMVGDGINDTPALATADVGIAMAGGTDIAMDVASITIMSDDLSRVPKALRLSLRTMRTIRQNLFWAFIYNVLGIPIAAGLLYPFTGFMLNPMVAGAAMALSSVSVVLNSLRLRYVEI